MQQTHLLTQPKKVDLVSPLISTLIIVLFLFFIDEGYYDLRWMKDVGNWFVFGIYLFMFFPIQWAISHFLFRSLNGWQKILAMVVLSVPATILFFWWIL